MMPEIFCCDGCGRDTTNPSRLCDACGGAPSPPEPEQAATAFPGEDDYDEESGPNSVCDDEGAVPINGEWRQDIAAVIRGLPRDARKD
jgi:hypothetical protein